MGLLVYDGNAGFSQMVAPPRHECFVGSRGSGAAAGVQSEALYFAFAQGVIRHQLDPNQVWQGFSQVLDAGKEILALVAPGDDGGAHDHLRSAVVKHAEVLLDAFERHPGERDVLVRVCFLDVDHEQVDERHQSLDRFGFGVPARLHSGMKAVASRSLQQAQGEIELKRGFAAGQGHSAARCLVEGSVAENLRHDFPDGDFAPNEFQSMGIAFLGALPAHLAPGALQFMRNPRHAVRAPRAHAKTVAATDALARVERETGPR